MCEKCIEKWKEDLIEALVPANEHMDSQGIPEDALCRKMAEVQLAMNINPTLKGLMLRMYPTAETLLQ